LIRTSSDLAVRRLVIFRRDTSAAASVRGGVTSRTPVTSKLALLGQVKAICAVFALGEIATDSVSVSPGLVKVSVIVRVGAAAGPGIGETNGGGGGGGGCELSRVNSVVVLTDSPVESETVTVPVPSLPEGRMLADIVFEVRSWPKISVQEYSVHSGPYELDGPSAVAQSVTPFPSGENSDRTLWRCSEVRRVNRVRRSLGQGGIGGPT
jgi:hypothetical protein